MRSRADGALSAAAQARLVTAEDRADDDERHGDSPGADSSPTDSPPADSSPTDSRPADPRPADQRPDRPGVAGLAAALNVRRNVARGAVVGLAVAVLAYLVRVLELFGPVAGTREFPVVGPAGWFLVLAFVLFASTTLLAATAFTVGSAVRLARDLD